MNRPVSQFATLVELLCARAEENAGAERGYTFLTEGETETEHLSWRELDLTARRLGARLAERGLAGERALLLYPPGLDFVKAFFGCLYAGVVAVPAYPPSSARTLPRLASIVSDARPAAILTTTEKLAKLESLSSPVTGGGDGPLWLASDEPGADADAWRRPALTGDSLAFLQYTSGSTSAPKGVKVTHANLLHNEEMIRRAFAVSEDSVIVGWLPLFHDMGLIGNVLQPLYAGGRCVLMSPMAFLSQPRRWLEAVTRYRATTSGGPDFAYELCVRKVPAEQREGLDLSCWEVAFNGAEPVRASTLERFAEAFAPQGFRREAFHPCYGLAEATLLVSVGEPDREPRVRGFDKAALADHRAVAAPADEDASSRRLVGCGHAWADQVVLVVDPESRRRLPSGEVGEIWVSGPSVAQGYYRKPEVNEREFRARLAGGDEDACFLRTGDLGFFDHDGELFITGRFKDLLIIRGRNHYPQDVELTVEQAHPALRAGCAAAFSVEVEGEERLVVAVELERQAAKNADFEAVGEAVRREVAEAHELQVHEVLLLRTGTLPKTSSGKVRRHACRQGYLGESLSLVGRSTLVEPAPEPMEATSRESLLRLPEEARHRRLLEELSREVARAARRRGGPIDPREPLVALGLDSLAAVELTQRLEDRFGVAVAAVDLLAGLHLDGLATHLEEGLAARPEEEPVRAARPDDGLEGGMPLSFGQKAIWLIDRLSPSSSAYHIAGAARVRPGFDAEALERALEALARRHEALRSVFTERDGEPLQETRDALVPELLLEDATTWSEAQLQTRMAQEAYRPFDLSAGPLLRLAVFRHGGTEDTVLLSVHHIVADFWSLSVLLRELVALYGEHAGGPPARLVPLASSYGEHVRRQQEVMSSAQGERLWSYWKERLAGVPPVLELPTDRPRPAVPSFRGARVQRQLHAASSDGVRALARRSGATPFMVLLAAFQSLLQRVTGQRKLAVGTPTAGRDLAAFDGLIGYFVNPLVLAADFSGAPTVREHLARTRRTVLEDFAHRGYPFALLTQRLHPDRDPDRSPLFQVMLVWQQARRAGEETLAAFALGWEGAKLRFGDLTLESRPLAGQDEPFDLSLMAAEWDGEIRLSLSFDGDLFDATTARRMLESFEVLLAGMVAEATLPEGTERRLAELPLTSAGQRHQLLAEWNDPAGVYPRETTVHELFEAQAERTPAALAVVGGEERLTYRALDRRSNRLAHELRALGVGAETVVGLAVERASEVVPGLLGILKAGGVCLPLDPSHPAERLTFILEDAAARAVVAEGSAADSLADAGLPMLRLEADAETHRDEAPPSGSVQPANLAYVIYTSGTTGRPKGVGVTHRQVVPLLRWSLRYFGLGEHTRVLQNLSYAFDFGFFELVTTLLGGGTLYFPAPEERGDFRHFVDALTEHRINTVHSTPAFFREVTAQGRELPSLEVVHLGGEALSGDLVRCIRALVGGDCRVYNGYGPTEASINCTIFRMGGSDPVSDTALPIGRASAHNTVYVLDRDGRLVPVGVPGELAVGGDGVARGYLGRPAVTAEKFVPDPFGGRGGKRLYRTGDLVRRLGDGNLAFLGRIDHQVKVRGFRIELGEIETVLRDHPAVREAVVAVRAEPRGTGREDRRLVAYVVAEPEASAAAEELRDHLRAQLPDYMVPTAFVPLATLPLNPNGKVDRAALLRIALPESATPARAPRGATEELLAGIFSTVLGLDEVGPEQDFFTLGGHSLLATQVVSRIRSAFAVEVALRKLFENPTVAGLAACIEEARRGEAPAPAIVPEARDASSEARFPLSFAQQRLWFLDQLEPMSSSYNIPGALRLAGELDVEALRRSLEEIVRRHETLRTSFHSEQGQPVQVIRPVSKLRADDSPLSVADLQGLPAPARQREQERLVRKEARRPFDLSRGPLLRATLVRLAKRQHVLLVTMHHIVSDGWSSGVLVRELRQLYSSRREGTPSPLPKLPVQYADFAGWQRRWLAGEELERQLSYWRQRLAGAPPLELPTDRPRPPVLSGRGAERRHVLPPELLADLRRLSRQQGTTLFMTLMAAFQEVLHRWSGQDDLSVGTPVANRTRAEIEGLVGFFVNNLVLRGELAGDPSFSSLLAQVRESALQAYAHQDVPFERLVEELGVERELDRTPLFQVLLVLEDAPVAELSLPGLDLSFQPIETGTVKFDLTLRWTETGDTLRASLGYRTELFDATTVERWLRRFETLLRRVVSEPGERLSRHELLAAGERHQLLLEWGGPHLPCPEDPCVHQLFEQQARRMPAAVALHFEGQKLSYGELDCRADQLAYRLRDLGVGRGSRVAICTERSPEMVVGLLAILKAGGAYVPLDPEYPAERLAFMLEDAAAEVLLTQERLLAGLPSTASRVVCLDDGFIPSEARQAFPSPACADDPAYVIYTSGSTGRPKGAVNVHRGVVNRLLGMQEVHRLRGDDRVLHKTPFSFDVSVWEIFWPLSVAAQLVLARPGRQGDAAYLIRKIREEEVTVLHFVPSMLEAFLAQPDVESCVSLRQVTVGGEALSYDQEQRFLRRSQATLYHFYGPTEAAIEASFQTCRPCGRARVVPIGRPVTNTDLRVLDRGLRPVPLGARGELAIGGVQVALGYLGRPALTAEKFVPDPFAGPAGARLYRTGDLVRHLANGELEYLGRLDHQVKVRGFRIELGEVATVLRAHPAVREAVVAVRGTLGGVGREAQRLVAYVVPEPGPGAAADELRAHLRAALPDYMVPAAFVPIERVPLTPNGKVDRAALGRIALPEPADAARQTAPRTPAEEMLAGIFSAVLGLGEVGVEQDFFELGGHSLLATQAVSRIRSAFGVELPLRDLFERPTVAELAARVEEARRGEAPAVPPLVPREQEASPGSEFPLSFAQQRLWFLDQLEPASSLYNVPGALRLTGELDVEALRRSFGEIVRRHQVLRTSFHSREGRPVQVIHPVSELLGANGWPLVVSDLRGLPEGARQEEQERLAHTEARCLFDLAQGPLLRTTLVQLGEREHVLLVTMHHIVSDGWSLGVLIRELRELYGAWRRREPSPLEELPLQYTDFASWQHQWLAGEELERQLAYWRQKLAGAPPLELPTDRPRPPVLSHRGSEGFSVLPPELLAELRHLSRQQGATLFMTLMAAFQEVLHRASGQDDLLVGTPVANRTRAEIEGLVGFFVNSLVLRGDLSGDPTFSAVLAQVRESALQAYAHQDVPFERLVEALGVERDLGRTPLFQVLLVLQNAPVEELSLPDLTLELEAIGTGTAKFDLTLLWSEAEGALCATLEYRTELFDATTIARLLRRFETLLRRVVSDPQEPMSRLDLLDPGERHQLLTEWVGSHRPCPRDPCIHELFEEQVRKAPKAVALRFEDQELSYGELDRRADRLAFQLRHLGVGRGSRVALCIERSLEMVVGLLGILKAGGAYVPLDPAYPAERLAFMLEDSSADVLLTQERLLPGLPAYPGRVICLDADPSPPQDLPPRDDQSPVQAGDPAYVIYTSGSTGRPKGVMNVHRGVVNRLLWLQELERLDPSDRVLQKTPFSFDVSVWEFFWPLLAGARLVLARPGAHGDAGYLVRTIREQEITTLHFVPSMLEAFLEHPEVEACDSLRRVVASGEALPYAQEQRLLSRSRAALYNLYGPTEAAIEVSFWVCRPSARPRGVPIGRPVANTHLRVLGNGLRPVPIGVRGELAIGGVQVAVGYLNRPALTAEKFVPDPTTALPGTRLYRTGDLVRHLANGDLEYLGRLDHQVKIRGFRIELGEVEATLASHPGVREVVTLAEGVGGGNVRLVAFLVPSPELRGEAEELPDAVRQAALERLPDYMVPSLILPIDELPLLPNGKVNRRLLAELAAQMKERGTAAEHVAPRDAVEKELAEVWAEVLGLPAEDVGVHDDFFALGGHSLLATRVISRLRRRFGVELALKELFAAPTVAGLARRVGNRRGDGAAPLLSVVRGEELPLSFAQERLWFLEQLEPGGIVYNLPGARRLRGPLSVAALRAAFQGLVERHEVLRTTFCAEDGRPRQVISPPGPHPLPLIDLTALAPDARDMELGRRLREASRRSFDLRRGPLLRTHLIRLGSEEHVVFLCFHHAVSDGWSISVLGREVSRLYAASLEPSGSTAPLPVLPVQYADYSIWQRERLGEKRGASAETDWWRERLSGMPELLQLPTDRPRPARLSHRAGARSVAWSPELREGLERWGQRHGATLYMTLLTAFQALLARYTGSADVPVGSVVAGRTQEELEPLIGFFVNTLVMRGDLSGDPGLGELLVRTREATLEAWAHQEVPFGRLVEELRPERSLGHAPLAQVLLVLQNTPDWELHLAGVEISDVEVDPGTARFDLELVLEEGTGVLAGHLRYREDLFDVTTAARMVRHLERLLSGAVADPTRRLSRLPLLGDAERAQLLLEWNDTAAWNDTSGAAEETLCLHELFLAQAARTPDAPAVVDGTSGEVWSYRELDRRSALLAAHLRRLGVQRETCVGVCLPRTAEIVAALLAVLRAGAAYVPLDPVYPAERQSFLLRDSRVAVVLSHSRLAASLPAEVRTLWLDELPPEAGADASAADPRNLAYLIYTSGSTGLPKGVAIPHTAATALVRWARRSFAPEELRATLAATSICFDLSVFEIFVPLSCGGSVVVAENALALPAVAQRTAVTLVNTVPSAMNELVRLRGLPPGLRTVNLAGEPLTRELARGVYRTTAVERLYNLYGPSEDTTYSTYCRVPRDGSEPTIGRPITGTRARLLDARFEAVPIGVAGELCLAGSGLARGYLGRPGLTAAKFVPDPFGDAPGERLYRTGDLVRQRGDGELLFLGRLDHQVKLRGYRIELGEVESRLTEHPRVREALVTVWGAATENPRLVAYVIADAVEEEELTQFLEARLPAYMLPAATVFLDAFPLTPNGKVDRRALPAPTATTPLVPEEDRPQTPLEEMLAAIWCDLLELPSCGRGDDFFARGGHSLLATRLVSRIERDFAVELPLASVFEASTLAALASRIEAAQHRRDKVSTPPIRPVGRQESLPLSYAQERLWFFAQTESESTYNDCHPVRLRGRLSVTALQRAFGEIVRRHEVLRTTFRTLEGRPCQSILPSADVAMDVVDLRQVPAAEATVLQLARAEIRRPFDLERGPLLRIHLAVLREEEHVLLLTLHHIVSDGWSMGVLLRELSALYGAFSENRPSPLRDLRVQYGDFAVWQREVLHGELLESHLDYWTKRLSHAPPLMPLPLDRPRPAVQSFRGASYGFKLPGELSVELKRLSRREGATLFMTLLSVFQLFLYRLTDQEDLVVGTDIANRNRAELEGLIGFFVNLLVLRGDLSGNPTFRDLLARVRRLTLEAYAHQDLPFASLIERLRPQRSTSHLPLVQVLFVLQNAPFPALELGTLRLEPVELESGISRFDLAIFLIETADGIRGVWKYNTDLFDPETIARFSARFETLLRSVVSQPDTRLRQQTFLSEKEQQQQAMEKAKARRARLDAFLSAKPRVVLSADPD